jgi:integrase
MKVRIVQRTIQNLAPPKRGNLVTWDTEIPGFGVRITSTGVIAFVLDYRLHGRKRRFTIGRHPELSATAARERTLELRRGILDGRDPLEGRAQDRDQPTLNELATEYLERHALPHKRPSSIRNDRQMIDVLIRPRLGSLRVKAVLKRDLELLHTSLKATPYRANRVRALLSKMFNLAVEWGWRGDNPVRGIPKFHEDRREIWLSVEQLHEFSKALDNYPNQDSADALRLLLLTGSREQEVLKAEWPQFDLKRGTWEKPSHATKEKKTEHVPLNEEALQLLRSMKKKSGRTSPLFPGKKGNARTTVRRPWLQACKAAGLVAVYSVKGKRCTLTRYRPTVRLHDLRHTFASHLVSSGVSLQKVGQLLGHTQAATTQRYAHLQDEVLRDATNVFGKIFKAAGKTGK